MIRVSGNSVAYISSDANLIDTVLTIDDYKIFWKHARELNVSSSVEETTGLKQVTINGRGMVPPPFTTTSFNAPVQIYFRKQEFEELNIR